MSMILKISLRNLIRQKRRNLLLGIGIAFGMSILIISNAFSHGMSELLLNRFILWITGHIKVTMIEKDEREWHIIRDKERLEQVIRQTIDEEIEIFEDVHAEGRALGNGSAESVIVKGVELSQGFFQDIKASSGNPEDILNPNIENPIILYEEIAESLQVQVNDQIQVGFQNVYRQIQTARFTVVAILKGGLPFIDSTAYTHINILKPLLGYKDHETSALNIVIKDLNSPAVAREQANRLHQALVPDVAGYIGMVRSEQQEQQARFFAVTPNASSRQTFVSYLEIVEGSLEDTFNDESAILVSQDLARSLNVRAGDQVSSMYVTRFKEPTPGRSYRVGAIFRPNDMTDKDMVFLHPRQFYTTFFPLPPQNTAKIDRNNELSWCLLKEWTLLERSVDDKALELKYDELADSNWRGAVLDVQTMYELARSVLNFEIALDIATSVAVAVLFFIILIGVVNTLRMTIRERTREIGTVRAIGMQQSDVRWSFLSEVLLLALFAGVAGIGVGHVVMQVLSLLSFEAEGGLLMFLLVDKHLYFLPTLTDMVRNLGIITLISFATAFFPASNAAKLSVTEALRQYE